MHAGSFSSTGYAGAKKGGIQGPKACTLETLVSTLAALHFTTKGKVGEDGKFELIFCSPEPVVSVETPKAEEPRAGREELAPIFQREVHFVEPKRRHHSHRKSKGLLF
jgi:hypothetical protein